MQRFGLYGRVISVNACVMLVAFLLLALSPVTVSAPITSDQLVVLIVGLVVLLVANAALVWWGLRPLEQLRGLMSEVDVLEPGRRLPPTGSAEVAAVIRAFNATLTRLEDERRTSIRRVVGAQEAERQRIAQELHDAIGQNLTAVILELKRTRQLVGVSDDRTIGETIAEAQELTRESLEELRRIVHRLRPSLLDDLGLARAVEALADGLAQRTGMELAVDVDERLLVLTRDAELVLYRVAQEALTNVARHAQGFPARLALHNQGGAVVLTVSDDGAGASRPTGGGIRGMQERALAIGAQLTIETTPGTGFRVVLAIPAAVAGD
jgi:two-component system sensor histidine kinase UhpB